MSNPPKPEDQDENTQAADAVREVTETEVESGEELLGSEEDAAWLESEAKAERYLQSVFGS